MDKKQDPNLYKYLIFAGALGLSYLMVNYLSKDRKSKLKPLSIERTKQALREIKYQMLTTCNSYSEAVNRKTNGRPIEEDLQIAFRTEVAKLYEGRQQVVLEKLDIGKDEYAKSLESYKKNPKIEQDVNEIISMMERTIKGRSPDMSVPPQASARMQNADLCQIYLQMCEMISIRMWEKLSQCKKDNPSFNSRDEIHYKRAMKELSIYSLKMEFLATKGFEDSWGSPNEIFYKLLETQKLKSEAVKAKCIKIERAFDKVIEKVTQDTDALSRDRIKFILAENMQQINEAPKPQAQARPFNGGVAVSKSVGAPPKKKEEDDQFSMDNLMMQELLNRSAEEPKNEQQKKEPIKQETPKVVQKEQSQFNDSPLKKEDEAAAAPVGGVMLVQPAEGKGQIQSPKRRPLLSKQTIEGWFQDQEQVGASQVGGIVIVNPTEEKTQIIDPPPRQEIKEENWVRHDEQEEKHEEQIPEPPPRQEMPDLKEAESHEQLPEIPDSPKKVPEVPQPQQAQEKEVHQEPQPEKTEEKKDQ